MPELIVKPVRSWLDRRRFLRLPWQIYRDDPHWIPPLLYNQSELLNYSFFQHAFYDNADIQTFLAYRGSEIVGRIAAIINHEHNRLYHEIRGFFGFYESINDRSVAHALFDAARRWLAQRGALTLRGPANPSMNYECGLLIEGFDSRPTFMMTHNPPYYAELFESYGLRPAHDMLAYMGQRAELPVEDEKALRMADQAVAFCEATLRPIRAQHFVEDVNQFVDLYNRSLIINWGFVPLPEREMRTLASSLQHLLIPELTIFAEVDGKSVGAVIGLPDYNPRIKQINGRLFPLGIFRLLSGKRDIERMRVVSINVVPEFQRWGLGLALLLRLAPKAYELGIMQAEFSWISHDNDLARRGLEKAGAKITKRYRMYDLDPGLRDRPMDGSLKTPS